MQIWVIIKCAYVILFSYPFHHQYIWANRNDGVVAHDEGDIRHGTGSSWLLPRGSVVCLLLHPNPSQDSLLSLPFQNFSRYLFNANLLGNVSGDKEQDKVSVLEIIHGCRIILWQK